MAEICSGFTTLQPHFTPPNLIPLKDGFTPVMSVSLTGTLYCNAVNKHNNFLNPLLSCENLLYYLFFWGALV